ncbi:hypothetical protein BDR05DRAFT_952398 [Suillus weaverae]|nr:hypothetical protein BDR05DRAFT_952398 [Suillus weaverae]
MHVARLPKVAFVEETDQDAFGFLDPGQVIRGVHLIPAFASKRSVSALRHGPSFARPGGELDDWEEFYIGIFAEWDMFIHYTPYGVGHPPMLRKMARDCLTSSQTPEDMEVEEHVEGDSGDSQEEWDDGFSDDTDLNDDSELEDSFISKELMSPASSKGLVPSELSKSLDGSYLRSWETVARNSYEHPFSHISTDEGDCRLPLTLDSNHLHSGGVYRTGLKSNTHKPYNHPYARPASFEDDDIFDRIIGRPCNNNVEEMNQATTDVFLQGLKGLSHNSLCHAVHYKEAVYQRKHTRIEMAKQELDETSKLHTFLHSISRDTDLEAAMAESERNFFMRMLVDHQATLPHPSTNISYSLAAQARDKKVLGQIDAELTLLQRHVSQVLNFQRLTLQQKLTRWNLTFPCLLFPRLNLLQHLAPEHFTPQRLHLTFQRLTISSTLGTCVFLAWPSYAWPIHLYPSAPGPSTLGPPTLSPPTPGPSAPAPVASASVSAPAAKLINFVMVMDGEKGKRVSKKTGIMKSRCVPKMPQALKDYDPHKPEDNATIVLIVEEVERKMQEDAIRQTMLTDQGDRELKVKAELKAAAIKHFRTDAASADTWADRNWVALYNHLSKPLSDIMRKLKSVAETHYIQGYALRPGARSPDALNEKSYAIKRVQELIPPAMPEDEFATLAFIFDIHSYPLEHPVIWNILLDTVSTLGYNKYIGEAESLDRLFMSTIAAIYSCLEQVPKGKKAINWIEYRRITHLKLTATTIPQVNSNSVGTLAIAATQINPLQFKYATIAHLHNSVGDDIQEQWMVGAWLLELLGVLCGTSPLIISLTPYMNIFTIRTGTTRSASPDAVTKAGYAYCSAELSSINKEDLEMMKYSYLIPTFKGVEGVTPVLKSLLSAYVLPLCHPIYH